MKKKNNQLLLEFGICVAVSILFLLVCSKNSPLYPMNDWVDVDCIFTMGKAMGDGKVPYLDIFDHKGPVLYFIFMIASWISQTSFFGVWVFEIISITGFLFFSMQSAKLFMKSKWVIYASTPVLALVVLTTRAFTHGGSTEELALLPLSYSLYYFLRIIRGEKVKKASHVLTGVCIGAIFWMKFTLVGLYIGAYMAVIIYRVYKKDGSECMSDILWNITGFMAVSVPVLLYFILNGALGSLCEVYFYDNIFLYGDELTLSEKMKNFHTRVLNMTYYNSLMVIPTYVSVAVYLFKGRMKEAILIIATLFTAALGIYYGGYLSYYAMIMAVFAFMGIGLIDEIYAIMKDGVEYKLLSVQRIGAVLVSGVLCFACCFNWSSNVYLMKHEKEDMPQYRFAKIINSVDNPTLLNYRFLDGGFYFAADVMPENKFFYRSNLVVPGMDEEQQALIRENKVDFVVTRQEEINNFVVFHGYECVAQETFYFEGKDRNYFLYERADLR